MRVRALVGLAALGAILAVAGFAAIGGFMVAPPDLADADEGIESVAPLTVAETKQDRAGPLPVAHAAIIDPLLFTPHPMLGTGSRSMQTAAVASGEPAYNQVMEVTASVRPVAFPPAAKRVVPPPRVARDRAPDGGRQGRREKDQAHGGDRAASLLGGRPAHHEPA